MPALSCSLFARQCRLGRHHQRCRRWCLLPRQEDTWQCPRDHSSEAFWESNQLNFEQSIQKWFQMCHIVSKTYFLLFKCFEMFECRAGICTTTQWQHICTSLALSFKMPKQVQIVPWKPGCCEAMNSGVAFVRLARSISPLNSKSFWTILKWPICAAMNKGVARSFVCEFGCAPKAKSTSATCRWPFWQATYNGVALVCSARSAWAWWSSKNFTAERHPPWLPMNKAVAPPLSLAVQSDQVEKDRLQKAEMAMLALEDH